MKKNEGEVVRVVHVRKRFASRVKTFLERQGSLNRDFRVAPSQACEGCVAIPVRTSSSSSTASADILEGVSDEIVDVGNQFCPYSVSRRQRPELSSDPALTLVQQAVLEACQEHVTLLGIVVSTAKIQESICNLSRLTCPFSLELLGDDRTIILPGAALCSNDPSLSSLLGSCLGASHPESSAFWQVLWKRLAGLHRSKRVVRRAPIDANSPTRQSRYEVLWRSSNREENSVVSQSQSTGPGCPGWITVTEQGIRQSFDLTRVMFSRGNITEKIRFGGLVQPGERVLDMYGGIGYFTLPALVHGSAAHVVVCEWNPDAIQALDYNLRDNHVQDRATILYGDCRRLAIEHGLLRQFDRVSLGLLPSSEGGWSTAVKALRPDKGGWLHVHGNVPNHEALKWLEWLCVRLKGFLDEDDNELCNDWIVLGHHLEKVKSFAPTVNHYVADVYIGPRCGLTSKDHQCLCEPGFVGCVPFKPSGLMKCRPHIEPPSCALSPAGALHQAWMR